MDGRLGHGIEEEYQQDDQCCQQQELQDEPLVVLPDNIPKRFQGIQKPKEGGVGTSDKM